MDYSFTQEQSQFQESISRFVRERYDFDSRQAIVGSEQGFSESNWRLYSELGWLAVPFSEENGGFGSSAVDLMILMQEFGKGLVVEPFLSTVLLFGGVLDRCGNRELAEPLVAKVIAGQTHGAFAFGERQSRFGGDDVRTTAAKGDRTYVLNGEKTIVSNGQSAHHLIVLARTSGAPLDPEGLSLFLVDPVNPGVDTTSFRLMDGQPVSNIRFTDVEVPADRLVGPLDQAGPLVREVVDRAIVAVSAEALGIMEVLLATTVEYAKNRRQFGAPIGSFQALQHRMVDMFIDYEQATSLLYRAVCSIEENAPDTESNILALKVMVGRAGRRLGGDSIQIHGGIGLTDELSVGHYVKRLLTINSHLGDADHCQKRFANLASASASASASAETEPSPCPPKGEQP